MRRKQFVLTLTEEQRNGLRTWAASRTLPAGDVFRARLILALANGQTYNQIKTNTANHRAYDLSLEAEI